MTSKLTKSVVNIIQYQSILPEGYLCPDPEYRVDSVQQSPTIDECGHVLRSHLSPRPDMFLDTGGFVFYDTSNLNRRVRPDLYLAFGVEPTAIYARNGYVIEEVGKPPDFILEVASESTHRVDTERKPELYARIGVGEYWRFDPTGGEYYGYLLAGDILVNGEYQPIPIRHKPDGMEWGYSPLLGLNLCGQSWRMSFHDPSTGLYLLNLLNLPETQAVLAEQTAALEASNAEVERLQEELRRLRGQ
jgi:hypothetical protein